MIPKRGFRKSKWALIFDNLDTTTQLREGCMQISAWKSAEWLKFANTLHDEEKLAHGEGERKFTALDVYPH